MSRERAIRDLQTAAADPDQTASAVPLAAHETADVPSTDVVHALLAVAQADLAARAEDHVGAADALARAAASDRAAAVLARVTEDEPVVEAPKRSLEELQAELVGLVGLATVKDEVKRLVALAAGGENDFGREALAELVKRMEDDRARLVVVLAGYTQEMDDLLAVNPGLRSRLQAVMTFPDYAPEELTEVLVRMATKEGWRLGDGARGRFAATLAARHAARNDDWANARSARALWEQALSHHALRVTADGRVDRAELDVVTADDVPAA